MNMQRAILDGLLVRLGTALSSIFLGYGIHSDDVRVIVPAILVLVGFAADLAIGEGVKRWQKYREGAN